MKYPGDISGEAYEAMEEGYEQGRASMKRHRPAPGTLLPESDPRVQVAKEAIRPLLPYDPEGPAQLDWRDVSEVVSAVLAADDAMTNEIRRR